MVQELALPPHSKDVMGSIAGLGTFCLHVLSVSALVLGLPLNKWPCNELVTPVTLSARGSGCRARMDGRFKVPFRAKT